MSKDNVFYATGRRKNAIAKTWLTPGSGKFLVNNKSVEEYFTIASARITLSQPLVYRIEVPIVNPEPAMGLTIVFLTDINDLYKFLIPCALSSMNLLGVFLLADRFPCR